MSKFEEYFLVIGCFQGCLLFALLTFDARLSSASRVLGWLCLVMASAFLMPFLRLAETETMMRIAGWNMFVPAAAGALAFLYCRSALLDQPLRAGDALLFLPFLACYLLVIDRLLGDPRPMLAWINGAPHDTWRLQASEYLLFLQAFAFAGTTAFMIWRYRRQASRALADYNPLIFRWLLSLQILTIVIWGLNALPALTSAPYVFAQAANLCMVLMVYLIAFAQWREPRLFRIARLADEQRAARGAGPAGSPTRGDDGMDEQTRQQLLDVISAEVEGRRLYLNSRLTLSELADATGLSRHQVSETLNRQAGKNFYEYINEYRVAAVCERLAAGDDEVILNIALDAGFSSKSAFNAIFKQFTGVTPSAYRRKLRS